MSDPDYLPGYYYLHSSGGIVFKPKSVMINDTPEEYFNSPFAVKHWEIKTEEEYEKMMKEVALLKRG